MAKKVKKSAGAKKSGRTSGAWSNGRARAGAATKPARIAAASKPRTKGDVFRTIAEHTGISKKQAADVFDVMGRMISADLSKNVSFNVPGLMKVTVVRKPATKGGQRPNPFRPGEMMEVKPRPARNVVKVRPLKALKERV